MSNNSPNINNGENNSNKVELATKINISSMLDELAPDEKFDTEVEEMLIDIAHNFIDNVAIGSSLIANHRNSPTLELSDVQQYLGQEYNINLFDYISNTSHKEQNLNKQLHQRRLNKIKKYKEQQKQF